MCTELFLAIIYFFTIFFVNVFLFKLVKNYLKNIFYLLKIKNIFKNSKKENLFLLSTLYFANKKDTKYFLQLKNLNSSCNKEDILLIGHIYKTIVSSKKLEKSIDYYLTLLKNQYLSEEK